MTSFTPVVDGFATISRNSSMRSLRSRIWMSGLLPRMKRVGPSCCFNFATSADDLEARIPTGGGAVCLDSGSRRIGRMVGTTGAVPVSAAPPGDFQASAAVVSLAKALAGRMSAQRRPHRRTQIGVIPTIGSQQ